MVLVVEIETFKKLKKAYKILKDGYYENSCLTEIKTHVDVKKNQMTIILNMGANAE